MASATWTDASGNLWLFGGYHDNNGNGFLNDLWSYNPGTGLWTWVNGSSTSNGGNTDCTNALGVYGVQGAATAGTTPGARLSPATWIDGAGHLWLHGGGCDSAGTLGTFLFNERSVVVRSRHQPVDLGRRLNHRRPPPVSTELRAWRRWAM